MATVTADPTQPHGNPAISADLKVRCHAKSKTTGEQCRQLAMKGGTVCRFHGGKAKQVRAKAKRRLAETQAAATLADIGVTPIGNPLLELAAVVEETRALQRHVANKVAEAGMSQTGEWGEQLTVWVPLLERMLDRTGRLLTEWVRLGFDERMVGLHERQAELVAQVVRSILADPELNLDAAQTEVAPAVARRHLTAIAGVAA